MQVFVRLPFKKLNCFSQRIVSFDLNPAGRVTISQEAKKGIPLTVKAAAAAKAAVLSLHFRCVIRCKKHIPASDIRTHSVILVLLWSITHYLKVLLLVWRVPNLCCLIPLLDPSNFAYLQFSFFLPILFCNDLHFAKGQWPGFLWQMTQCVCLTNMSPPERKQKKIMPTNSTRQLFFTQLNAPLSPMPFEEGAKHN